MLTTREPLVHGVLTAISEFVIFWLMPPSVSAPDTPNDVRFCELSSLFSARTPSF